MKLKIVTAASTTLTLLFGAMFSIMYVMYAEGNDSCWGFFHTLAGLSDCQDRAIALSRNAFCLSMITTIILLFSMLLFAMNQQHTLAEQKREADAIARTHTLTELKKQMDDQVAWLPEVEKTVNDYFHFKYTINMSVDWGNKTSNNWALVLHINKIKCGRHLLHRPLTLINTYNKSETIENISNLLIDDYTENGKNSSVFKALQYYTEICENERDWRQDTPAPTSPEPSKKVKK